MNRTNTGASISWGSVRVLLKYSLWVLPRNVCSWKYNSFDSIIQVQKTNQMPTIGCCSGPPYSKNPPFHRHLILGAKHIQ